MSSMITQVFSPGNAPLATARADLALSPNRFSSAIGSVKFPNSLGVTDAESRILCEVTYLDRDPGDTGADKTASMQNFLNQCYLLRRSLKTSALDDVFPRQYVLARFPSGFYTITSPLVIPEGIRPSWQGVVARKATGLTAGVATWDGNPGVSALDNIFQPAIIVPPTAGIQEINLLCNYAGVAANAGSGIVAGKTWGVASFTFGTLNGGGTGYVAGDVLLMANPSISPFYSARVTINTVDSNGKPLTGTLSSPGCYSMPVQIQKQIWSAANGFNVFDSYGSYQTTGGTGTGASIIPVWLNDFANATYNGGPTVIGNTYLGLIHTQQAGMFTDSTYGPNFGVMHWGLNHEFDALQIDGGQIGYYFYYANDIRGNRINPVACGTGIYGYGSTSMECLNCILDTPLSQGLKIVGCETINLEGTAFFPPGNRTNRVGKPDGVAAIILGDSTMSTLVNNDLNIRFSFTGLGGGAAGRPMLSGCYTKGSTITLNGVNTTRTGVTAPGAYALSRYGDFGPGWDASNTLSGQISGVVGAMFGGTALTAASGGFNFTANPANGDTITIGSTVLTFGSAALPIGASASATIASAASYIYANSANLNVSAAAFNQYLTINAVGPGSNIPLSYSSTAINQVQQMTGGAAAPPGGIRVWDASVNSFVGPYGVYERLVGAGAPTNNVTGKGKAPYDSIYSDTTGFQQYVNIANEFQPLWKMRTRAA